MDGSKFTEAAIIEQEKRYADLVGVSRTVATEVAESTRQMQALAEELARSSKMRDELMGGETRLAEIKQLMTELDQGIVAIASREQLVKTVKAEVETVHQISARS